MYNVAVSFSLFSINLVDGLNYFIIRLYIRYLALQQNGSIQLEKCPNTYGFPLEWLSVLHTNSHSSFDCWSISVNCLQVHRSHLFLRLGWPPDFSLNTRMVPLHWNESIPLLTDFVGEQWRINTFLDCDPRLFRERDPTNYALILFSSRIHFA